MWGEPKDIEGKCNARLSISDNFGDGHATILCQKDLGHVGLHQESYESVGSGEVVITWARHDPSYDTDDVERELREAIEKTYEDIEVDYEDFFTLPEGSPYPVFYKRGMYRVRYLVCGKDSVEVNGSVCTKAEALGIILRSLGGNDA